jgi:hypothetical protein
MMGREKGGIKSMHVGVAFNEREHVVGGAKFKSDGKIDVASYNQ